MKCTAPAARLLLPALIWAVLCAASSPVAAQWEESPGAQTPGTAQTVDPTQPSGPRYLLEQITVSGNSKTLRQVIIREVPIKPGEIFSAGDSRLEHARYRLLASGLFQKVEFSLKRGSRRGWAILQIVVKERNTIVVQDIVIGFSEITPYVAADVAERSLIGTGLQLSAAAVVSKEQWGYRLRFSDLHFLNSDFSLNVEGLYAHARDFFGNKKVCFKTSCEDPEPGGSLEYSDYAVMRYDRAGLRVGTGYTVLGDNHFYIDYRIEEISAAVPAAGSHISFDERQPIVFGHLLPGHSVLSSIILGIVRDTRDSFILSSAGHRTAFEVELSNEVIGSNYNYSKFTLSHDTYFSLGRGHSLRLGMFLGLIMGEAPFFNQFFVGDFSAFVPSRVLEMNFSHLQPNLLNTSIVEMRYEDMALSIGLEYNIPFYRGQRVVYGVNGFIGLGLFALASSKHLRNDPKGYEKGQVIPMDLTADVGIKIDTEVGLFTISLANLIRLIPSIGSGTTEP
jgi:outer membrane protein insertion porin family